MKKLKKAMQKQSLALPFALICLHIVCAYLRQKVYHPTKIKGANLLNTL